MSTNPVSAEFAAAIEDVQKTLEQTEFMSKWQPPATTAGALYNCQLAGMKTGVSVSKNPKDAGTRSAWIRLDWRILDGPYADQEFATFFSQARAFAMLPLFSLGSLLSGNPALVSQKLLGPTVDVVAGNLGKAVVEVRAVLRYNKEGREFTDFDFNRVIDILKS